MESLYHSTNRALQDAHEGFQRYERSGVYGSQEEARSFHRELQVRVETILR